MPATYSKKRLEDDDDGERDRKKHAGGPLKRLGQQADEFDEYLGSSLEQLSPTQLPTTRDVVRRYRALRIQQPLTPQRQLAKLIASEVWSAARVPAKSLHGCTQDVLQAIQLWFNCHRKGGRADPNFQRELDALFNVMPSVRGRVDRTGCGYEDAQLEHAETLIRSRNNPSWEEDYAFFVDQLKINTCTGLFAVFL